MVLRIFLDTLHRKRFNSRIMSPDLSPVLLTGDIVLDRHISQGKRAMLGDESRRGTH